MLTDLDGMVARLAADHRAAAGELRAFDPQVMARAVRGVIDSMAPRMSDTNLDLEACARELTTLLELAVRIPDLRGDRTSRPGFAAGSGATVCRAAGSGRTGP
jgi:hypothetical protein